MNGPNTSFNITLHIKFNGLSVLYAHVWTTTNLTTQLKLHPGNFPTTTTTQGSTWHRSGYDVHATLSKKQNVTKKTHHVCPTKLRRLAVVTLNTTLSTHPPVRRFGNRSRVSVFVCSHPTQSLILLNVSAQRLDLLPKKFLTYFFGENVLLY
jgi:hypothetical protein